MQHEQHGNTTNLYYIYFFFFLKQKTAYEIPKRDWSSDVCSPDLDQAAMPVMVVRHETAAPIERWNAMAGRDCPVPDVTSCRAVFSHVGWPAAVVFVPCVRRLRKRPVCVPRRGMLEAWATSVAPGLAAFPSRPVIVPIVPATLVAMDLLGSTVPAA